MITSILPKLYLFFCLLLPLQVLADTLATVGNKKITSEELKRKLDDLRRHTMNPPSAEQLLEDLIRFEVGVQEANKMKLQDDPQIIERYNQVLYNGLLEKQLGKKIDDIKISENELKEFYKKNPEVRVAHILIEIKTNAKPEEREIARKRANEIAEEVKKSKRPFEELVRLYTDDLPTKELGGDIGFQSRLTLVPVIYDSAVNMKVGEVRGPLETRFGFHIVKLLDRRAFDMADKRQIRAALFDEKRARAFNDYFEKTKKSYRIEINKTALKTLAK